MELVFWAHPHQLLGEIAWRAHRLCFALPRIEYPFLKYLSKVVGFNGGDEFPRQYYRGNFYFSFSVLKDSSKFGFLSFYRLQENGNNFLKSSSFADLILRDNLSFIKRERSVPLSI